VTAKREAKPRVKDGRGPIVLPIPFEEAVANLLKVKPPPEKKKRGTRSDEDNARRSKE